MACPQQNNIGAKRTEKLKKYRQLAFKTREQRPGYEKYLVPVIVGALGGGIKALKTDLFIYLFIYLSIYLIFYLKLTKLQKYSIYIYT